MVGWKEVEKPDESGLGHAWDMGKQKQPVQLSLFDNCGHEIGDRDMWWLEGV